MRNVLHAILSALVIAAAISYGQGAAHPRPTATSGRSDSLKNSPPTWALSIVADSAPAIVNVPFTLKARLVTSGEDSYLKFKLRWDFGGDGVWDYPKDGKSYCIDTTVSRTWSVPGKYDVIVEAHDSKSRTAVATINLLIHSEVEIDSIVGPQTLYAQSPGRFICRARAYRGRIAQYAWDFDNNGTFDTLLADSVVQYAFAASGFFTILCRVTDDSGRSATSRYDVHVHSAPTIAKAGGPYRTEVNAPLWLSGEVSDADNRIVSYSWDFENDGKVDWSSSENTPVEYLYNSAGRFTAAFIVATDDGRVTADSTTVEVFNTPPKAFAGEDIVSKKGKKVLLKGSGRDPNGKIVKYEWDFDGDGTFDWQSSDTGYVEYHFEQFSNAVLRVTDADGGIGYDTLRVVICPDDMVPVKEGRFCIDQYEWPNRAGEMPMSKVSLYEADSLCAKVGKRLCTGAEWSMACGGTEDQWQAYPYGKAYRNERCNTFDNAWGRNGPLRSGTLKECVSPYGAADMSGNLAEWTSETYGSSAYAYGGSWQSGDKTTSCRSRMLFDASSRYFVVGFRCCK